MIKLYQKIVKIHLQQYSEIGNKKSSKIQFFCVKL